MITEEKKTVIGLVLNHKSLSTHKGIENTIYEGATLIKGDVNSGRHTEEREEEKARFCFI